jgi:hypothetical protein
MAIAFLTLRAQVITGKANYSKCEAAKLEQIFWLFHIAFTTFIWLHLLTGHENDLDYFLRNIKTSHEPNDEAI